MAQQKPPQESPLANILINVLIPVLALSYLSKDPEFLESIGKTVRPWHIGPVKALGVAILFPIAHGIRHFIINRKLNFFSALGLASVLLTGGLTIYLWNEDGTVKENAAILFGLKEASIPLMLAIAVIGSHFTPQPLLRAFLYSDSIFDIQKIESSVRQKSSQRQYQHTLLEATLYFAGSFLLSSLLNFFLSLHFLGSLDHTAANARELYNSQVARLTGWGFAVIGIPVMVVLFLTLHRMLKKLERITGLTREEILLPR